MKIKFIKKKEFNSKSFYGLPTSYKYIIFKDNFIIPVSYLQETVFISKIISYNNKFYLLRFLNNLMLSLL